VTLLRRVEELTGGRFPWSPKVPEVSGGQPQVSRFVMFRFYDGKKDKLRPADVLGAFTAGLGLTREQVGTIKGTEWGTWVAVVREMAGTVEQGLPSLTIKGKVRRAVRVS
jgi:ATP-independent RNA helicase DbpA